MTYARIICYVAMALGIFSGIHFAGAMLQLMHWWQGSDLRRSNLMNVQHYIGDDQGYR
jgi:hypothetical protein